MANKERVAYYHLPGLFEFYQLYKEFLPLYKNHRDWFYDWCEIGSIYGAPADCIWGGGRVGFGDNDAKEVASLMQEYQIPARLTFSNSLLKEEHLLDKKCNKLCELFSNSETGIKNGIIVHSDLLLNHIKTNYPEYDLISSTTKVITDFDQLVAELDRQEFRYVVPDFRLNKKLDRLGQLNEQQKAKVEFLCNECCNFACKDRAACYENVSHLSLGEDVAEHVCTSSAANEGYVFSKAMNNPGFIGIDDICNIYLPMGFSNFKIEGRSLGSAIVLEFILYYMTKPEHQLKVREAIYLDASLDLF